MHTDEGVLDAQATFAAQAKCAKITEEFQQWLFDDPDRPTPSSPNTTCGSTRCARPATTASKLRLPGLSDHFTPHFYQRNAVARIIAEPTTLLDHVVGAGKTGTMLMAAMELRRLGLVRQPWIVVPNHIVEQVGREAAAVVPGGERSSRVGGHDRRRPPALHRPIRGQRVGHGDRAAVGVHRDRS